MKNFKYLNHFIENYDENYFKKLRNTYYLNWIDEIESDKKRNFKFTK